MKVGFDIDGVVAEFDSRFTQTIIHLTGRDLFGPGFIPRVWDYPEVVGYSAEELELVWSAIKRSPVWWETVPARPDAARILNTIHKRMSIFKDDVYFITARPGTHVKYQTEQWLRAKNTLNLSHSNEFSPTVLLSKEKGHAVKALELDAYIDDKPENCMSIPPATRSYMLRRSFNESDVEKVTLGGVIVVDSVADMFKDIGW